jgi:anaerobic magnesium-protoporphyrin IX monomethyl ester cyclase
MKNLLFVSKSSLWDQYSIFVLSTVLRNNGYSVDFIFGDIDDPVDFITSNSIDVVLFSVMSSTYSWFKETNDLIKSKFPQVLSIVGGPHFTFFPKDGVDDANVDYVVCGPGEEVILSILKDIPKEKCHDGKLSNISNLVKCKRDLVYDRYPHIRNSDLRMFISSRGCPFNCAYCFNKMFRDFHKDEKSKLFEKTDPKEFVDHIIDVKNDYGCSLIHIVDDDFFIDPHWIDLFIKEYQRCRIPFSAQINLVRVKDYESRMEALRSVGYKMAYVSIESANLKVRNFLSRPPLSNEDIVERIRILEGNDIDVRTSFIIGTPIDDPKQDALDSLEFAKSLNTYMSTVSILQPYCGTPLYDYCLENNLLDSACGFVELRDKPIIKLPNPEFFQNLSKVWTLITKYNIGEGWTDFLINNISIVDKSALSFLDKEIHEMRVRSLSR